MRDGQLLKSVQLFDKTIKILYYQWWAEERDDFEIFG
jgi:hypothetical protein